MMSNDGELICKPTKWFLWRAGAIGLMFAVGAYLFFKDWKYGYPAKNEERFYYLAFEAAEEAFREHQKEGKTPAQWEKFASEQRVFVGIDKNGETIEEKDLAKVLPAQVNLETKWPEVLASYDKYSPVFEEQENGVIPPAWKTFSNSEDRKWKEKVDHKLKRPAKIQEQFYIGILCLILLILALFVLFRTLSRSMRVDEEGYTPPGGTKIPFGEMFKIDARKWDTKGLATIHYKNNGQEKKAKVDGMVYGQFKKEEGEPAQKLYDRILANFKGELLELVSEDEDEPSSTEDSPEKNDSE